jgi:hypothetical protein
MEEKAQSQLASFIYWCDLLLKLVARALFNLHVRRLGSPLLSCITTGQATSKRTQSSLPAELAAPKTRLTWLQLPYSLAADVLHAHGATSTPPKVWCDSVART